MVGSSLIWLAFAVGASLALAGACPGEAEVAARRRLRDAGDGLSPADALERESLRRPLADRLLAPGMRRLHGVATRVTPAGMRDRLEALCREAGRVPDLGALLTTKTLVATVAAAVLALALRPHGGAVAAAAAAFGAFAGWRLPDAGLQRAAAQRRQALLRALPEVLDLLCISVEAGLAFDGAVQKVAEKFGGPVAEEFTTYLREVAVGRPRDEALRAVATRTRLPDIQALVAVVIQADRLGVSLSRVLRVQAEDLRIRRRQRAEEKAVQIPVKLLFPLVLFIFPALFLVLLGPAVLQVMTNLHR